ncbi:hypothetical protein [Microbacterium sp. No. 7]|uniref:hypothetical protein n=1 Tax=Microbacterium sp. No. 7 TaxID=1714373 RepID=UPI0006ED2106|nr:hypothetical protein [Microbacterium sp. No. 7]ALJ22075.1 hypothetical protein AOA12_20150 [Microbacterium sp. No. 7]
MNKRAQDQLDREMQRMKDMGITISVTPAAAGAREGFEERPAGLIADAAKRHGIYHGEDT